MGLIIPTDHISSNTRKTRHFNEASRPHGTDPWSTTSGEESGDTYCVLIAYFT